MGKKTNLNPERISIPEKMMYCSLEDRRGLIKSTWYRCNHIKGSAVDSAPVGHGGLSMSPQQESWFSYYHSCNFMPDGHWQETQTSTRFVLISMGPSSNLLPGLFTFRYLTIQSGNFLLFRNQYIYTLLISLSLTTSPSISGWWPAERWNDFPSFCLLVPH